ncbi:MAG: DNA modification methylase [Ignavibacteria bacterium]|jgi:type II restriction enzyme|nr:DNA modification methylase [Ignavibacteria bacterium]
MKVKDLLALYDEKKERYGKNAYKHISDLFIEAKEIHKRDFKGKDHEQSWRSFKGKNYEKIIEYILIDEIHSLGLEIVNGNHLERTINLSDVLDNVKRNLLVNFGEYGYHLPDVDLIIYNPKNSDVIAVVSAKVTLRERVAQTGYWKIKLSVCNKTKNVKVYLITLDEDNVFKDAKPAKKGRAIAEVDSDGTYLMTKEKFAISKKIKSFEYFINDLKKIIK